MSNHPFALSAPARLDFAERRSEIAANEAARLSAQIEGDEVAAKRLGRIAKALCERTLAEGIGRSQFSEARLAVHAGIKDARASLSEAESTILAALELSPLALPFAKAGKAPQRGVGPGAEVIPFPVRPRR